ncbi:MAG: thioredoxin family protein [Bacteroidetes bacterium]|nr:thioredoxin family protein [Bacteroidota bacterium]
MKTFLTMILLMITSLAYTGNPEAIIDKPAPGFTLVSTKGDTISLSDFKGKTVVLEWVNYDCPFVKKHYQSGNMPSLQKKWTEAGVVWLAICSSAPGKQGHFSIEDIQKRQASHQSNPTAYLIDETGTVGKRYGAKTTPHMFIISAEGTLVYAGAIDDKPSTDPDDIAGAVNYVSDALTAVLAGKPVAVKETKAYGCSVKY